MSVAPTAHYLNRRDFAKYPPDLERAEAIRIEIARIAPNPHSPRQSLPDLKALADSIKTYGLLQPITVRLVDIGAFEVLAGHRRLAAFQLLNSREPKVPGWRTIPAVVRPADTDDRDYLRLLAAQLHSEGWTPAEEASALERLKAGGLTLEQIADALHRTKSWASKRLRIYDDAVLSGIVQAGELDPSVAEELLPVGDVAERRNLAQRATAEAWSQSKARAVVRAKRTPTPAVAHVEDDGDALEEQVRQLDRALSFVHREDLTPELAETLDKLQERIRQVLGLAGLAEPRAA